MDDIVYTGLIVVLALFIAWTARSESPSKQASPDTNTLKRPKTTQKNKTSTMEERIRQRRKATY